MAAYPLRFATVHDYDGFLEALKEKHATDRYFVAPMLYDQRRQKWGVNKAWADAQAELVVFVQVDDAPVVPPATEVSP